MADRMEIALTETMPADAKHGISSNAHRKMMEIPDAQPIPSVNLIVHPHPTHGYNLEVQVTHFKFALENVNIADRPGEVRAHLSVNGKKLARLYGNWYYLDESPAW